MLKKKGNRPRQGLLAKTRAVNQLGEPVSRIPTSTHAHTRIHTRTHTHTHAYLYTLRQRIEEIHKPRSLPIHKGKKTTAKHSKELPLS